MGTSLSLFAMGLLLSTLILCYSWWQSVVETETNDHEDELAHNTYSSSEETAVGPDPHPHTHNHNHVFTTEKSIKMDSPNPSPPVYNPPQHPTSIFSFPTPTAYCAPPNPTAALSPVAQGSASELFKCVVKKPDVVQLEINGEMQSNASDVTTQFLAELRVYTTLPRHRNIAAFLGCLENVGMVLEFVEGRTLYEVVKARPELTRGQKVEYHNQLLDGLTHLHSYGLSHGDISLLNIQVTHSADTIKLLDFGRSVSADSDYTSPEEEPLDPFALLASRNNSSLPTKLPTKKIEQIHPGTRPFCAPEVLRKECTDALLADAYSFGVILICLDRCESIDMKPWEQRKDLLPKDLFDGCSVFEERAKNYLKRWDQGRRRLLKEDIIEGAT